MYQSHTVLKGLDRKRPTLKPNSPEMDLIIAAPLSTKNKGKQKQGFWAHFKPAGFKPKEPLTGKLTLATTR